MKRKIVLSMTLIALTSIIVSMVLSGLVSYYDSLKIIKKATVTESEYMVRGLAVGGEDYLSGIHTAEYGTSNQSVRVTLIDPDGTVTFDSVADVAVMENHSDRPEVIEARADGVGESIRESDTVDVQSYNYAVLLDNGCVLRLSVGMKSVFGSIERMVPWMLLCSVVVLVLAVMLSTYRTRQIVEPINMIDIDNPMENHIYPELSPLLMRIDMQNKTIQEKMEELRRKQEEFTTITENMHEGFIVVGSKGEVLSHNTSAIRVLGSRMSGSRANIFTFNSSPELRNAVDTALDGSASECVLRIDARSYNLIANPVQAENGVHGAVVILLDVTEKEERERMRREFTANVSHELKTPLTSISGYAEIIQNGLVRQEDIPRFAGNIHTEAQRMITLVEDILKLSHLDERTDIQQLQPVELLSLSEDIAQRLRVPAEKNALSVEVTGESVTVQGVMRILDEMIFNLADNAIKYNRSGGTVRITVGDADGHPFVEVADTGIGIPAADRERVFERFYRVDKSRSKQIGGTGLGLSIVKHGAAFHNARVTLDSEENKGTRVRITF